MKPLYTALFVFCLAYPVIFLGQPVLDSQPKPKLLLALGTGRSTGHIATLYIKNESSQPVELVPSTYYIPASHGYQSYVGHLNPGVILAPDTVQSVPLMGYCTDVHRMPAKGGASLAIEDWILVAPLPDSMMAYRLIQPGDRVDPYGPVDRRALNYSAQAKEIQSNSSSRYSVCWPDDHQPLTAHLDPNADPRATAALVVRLVQQIEDVVPDLQANDQLSTPYHPEPIVEKRGVTQHAIWITMGALSGKTYDFEDFTKKMHKLWQESSGALSREDAAMASERMESGLPALWQAFEHAAGASKTLLIHGENPQNEFPRPEALRAPWDQLDLTAPSLKPAHRISPVLIWTPAGAIVAGGAALLLTGNKEKPEPHPDLILRDDAVNLDCDGQITFSPLTNDSGEGLIIRSVSSVNSADVGLDASGLTVTISNLTQSTNFQFNLVVEDMFGQQGSSTVSVTVNTPEISALDDRYDTEFGTPVNGNVLDNDQGDNLRVIAYDQAQGGSLLIQPDGSFKFIPDAGYSGTTTTKYTVSGPCGLTREATITIEVAAPTCSTTASFDTSPASCGGEDGEAILSVAPPGSYQFTWSNGSGQQDLSNVPSGAYTVTITDENGCSQAFSTTIPERSADYLEEYSSTPANCRGDGGDIILRINAPDNSPLAIIASGPDGDHGIVRQSGTIHLKEFYKILPGTWQIRISGQDEASHCVIEQDIEVADTSTALVTRRDVYTTFPGIPVSGNLLQNDAGIDLKIVDFTQPAQGVLLLQPDGTFKYSPPPASTGDFVIVYRARDDCGHAEEQEAVFQVVSDPCSFQVRLDVTPTYCGTAQGAIHTQVYPEGEYSYVWSNGSTLSTIESLASGTYSVLINPVGSDCPQALKITVPDTSFHYITDTVTQPGTCKDGGNIEFTLHSPTNEPVILQVKGPSGSSQISLMPGRYNLDAIFPVPSGDYELKAFLPEVEEDCAQSLQLTVPDNSPPLRLNNDSLATAFRTPVNGNVFENDEGAGLKILSAINAEGGNVRIEISGDFSFNPHGNFSGFAGFQYIAQDACGEKDTATVIIHVFSGSCNLEPSFAITPATCGLANGSSELVLNGNLQLDYEWSNGDSMRLADSLLAGTYQLQVFNPAVGCMQQFEVTIPQEPAEYIIDHQIIQPDCPNPGDILLVLSSPNSSELQLEVKVGDKVSSWMVPADTVRLSELFTVLPGNYSMRVRNPQIDSACFDSFTAELIPSIGLTINTISIVPASSPMSADGSMTVSVTAPGTLPYQIQINGSYYGSIPHEMFSIFSLTAGTYRVQIRDAIGCLSNLLEVVIPVAPFSLEVEGGTNLLSVLPGNEESVHEGLNSLAFLRLNGYWNQQWQEIAGQLSLRLTPLGHFKSNAPAFMMVSVQQSLQMAKFNAGCQGSQLLAGIGANLFMPLQSGDTRVVEPYVRIQGQWQYQWKSGIVFRVNAQLDNTIGNWWPTVQGSLVIPVRKHQRFNYRLLR